MPLSSSSIAPVDSSVYNIDIGALTLDVSTSRLLGRIVVDYFLLQTYRQSTESTAQKMITSSIRAQTRNVLFSCCRLYFPNGIATPRTLLPACSRVGLSRMQPLHGRIGQRHISSIDGSGERSSEQAQQPDVLLGVSPGSQPQVRTTHPDATSTLFVGKLSPWATVADIEELFQGYGDMQVRMRKLSHLRIYDLSSCFRRRDYK